MDHDPEQSRRLKEEWLRNEDELDRLRELPVSQSHPVAREQELDRRQDEIEFELSRLWRLDRSRELPPSSNQDSMRR